MAEEENTNLQEEERLIEEETVRHALYDGIQEAIDSRDEPRARELLTQFLAIEEDDDIEYWLYFICSAPPWVHEILASIQPFEPWQIIAMASNEQFQRYLTDRTESEESKLDWRCLIENIDEAQYCWRALTEQTDRIRAIKRHIGDDE